MQSPLKSRIYEYTVLINVDLPSQIAVGPNSITRAASALDPNYPFAATV
jgi:hypothetical protein